MPKIKKVIACCQILAGVLFISAVASDIQLGFALVLLLQGVYNFADATRE